MPSVRTRSSPPTIHGGSWVSSPMPCPVRCMNASPRPASLRTSRAAASMARAHAGAHRGDRGRLRLLEAA
jgi:hypothetical protein